MAANRIIEVLSHSEQREYLNIYPVHDNAAFLYEGTTYCLFMLLANHKISSNEMRTTRTLFCWERSSSSYMLSPTINPFNPGYNGSDKVSALAKA